jgi:hypothetical protein
MTEPEPLADDLLEYVAAARETEPVPAALKERLLARLGPMLPPDDGGGSDGGGSPSDGGGGAEALVTGATASVVQSKVFVAAVAAVIGAAGGATGYATLAPPRTVITYMPAASAPAPTPAAPEQQPASIAPPPVAVEPAAPSTSAPVPAPRTSSEAPAPRRSTMRAERILLEAANAALLRGDHAAALAALRKHERRYPRGELVQERDVLMAQAKKLSAADEGSTPR